MTQHIPLDHEDILHEGFTDPIQELLGAYQPTNFRLVRVNATTLKVAASTDNDQVGIAINGRYRWRTTETTAALPGGLPNGEHPVFVTASDNNFTGPVSDPDAPTVYTFGLEIQESGKTPSTALWREVGKVTVSAGAITAIRQTVGSVSGAQIENGALSSEAASDITWTREAGGGLVAGLKTNSVGAAELADEAVDTNAIIALAVTTAKIAAEAINEGKLANNAVTAAKINALAVTTAKIAALAVTTEKLAEGAVETSKIENLGVTAAKLAAEAVETGKVQNLAITAAKLAAEAVETAKIKNLAVTTEKLAEGAVSPAKIAAAAKELFLQMAVATNKKVGFGKADAEWNPEAKYSKETSVAHGLGTTPTVAFAITAPPMNLGFCWWEVTAYEAANIKVRGNNDGAISAGQKQTFAWMAIG